MGVHCIMFIGNMWKLLLGSEDVYILKPHLQSVASCARASAAGGSAQMIIEQLYSYTL